MELSVLQMAAILVTVLIARTLAKGRRRKENMESLYPPEMKIKEKKAKDAFEELYPEDQRNKTKKRGFLWGKKQENLYPPEKELTPDNDKNKGVSP